MTQEILALCGIPASGKTTFARKFCRDNPGYYRVNQDDLRHMIGIRAPFQSALVYDVNCDVIDSLLEHRCSVVVDNVNLHPVTRQHLAVAADHYGAKLRWMYFDDSRDLDLCLRRNAQRTGAARVPDDLVRAMHQQYMDLMVKLERL